MAFKPSAKMIARKRGIDIQTLLDILSYRRPHNSEGVQEFLNVMIDPIEGIMIDDIGNRYLRIPNADGSQSNVLWSCHSDTVHGPIRDGVVRQNLKWDGPGNVIGLNQGKSGQCLGADDGAGIWLLMEMIKVGKPGLYIIHAGEERGGIGSHWLEKNTPEILEGIDFAIAFDRKDVNSVITFQGGTRCCSDAFGKSLAVALNRVDGLSYKLDQGGSFTDTAVYTDLVAECTNVSVGYDWAHGPRETLDIAHMIRLRDALLQLDTSVDLVKARTPGERESRWASSSYGGFNTNKPGQALLDDARRRMAEQDKKAWGTKAPDERDAYEEWLEAHYNGAPTGPLNVIEGGDANDPESVMAAMTRIVLGFPRMAARLLFDAGFDQFDLADEAMLGALAGEEDSDPSSNIDFKPEITCASCDGRVDPADVEDDRCPYCYASLSDPMGEALENAGCAANSNEPAA